MATFAPEGRLTLFLNPCHDAKRKFAPGKRTRNLDNGFLSGQTSSGSRPRVREYPVGGGSGRVRPVGIFSELPVLLRALRCPRKMSE